MANTHEYQLPASTFLGGDVDNLRRARHLAADHYGALEPDPASRPHAPWERNGRKEPAALRMSVGADMRVRRDVRKQSPVPQRGQRVTRLRRAWMVQRGGQLLGESRRDQLTLGLRSTDPCARVIVVEGHLQSFGVSLDRLTQGTADHNLCVEKGALGRA
ncbi:hypothetical protein PSAB6_580031 [Paraburkholderia sabiae]|nr:hypothetical protein PSAB6_580031 [Paraburkholderia sabiae]